MTHTIQAGQLPAMQVLTRQIRPWCAAKARAVLLGLAALLVLPTALWCAFASVLLIRTLQLN